jgi:hypothetical protein
MFLFPFACECNGLHKFIIHKKLKKLKTKKFCDTFIFQAKLGTDLTGVSIEFETK